MTKRLIDAAERLAYEASTTAEYSDSPELQEAIAEVRAATEQAREIGFGVEPTIWMFAIKFLAKVNDCQPARVSCDEDDGVFVIALTWQRYPITALLVISDDGDGDFSLVQRPGEQLAVNVQSFKIADGVPDDLEQFIRMNFTLNQTVQ